MEIEQQQDGDNIIQIYDALLNTIETEHLDVADMVNVSVNAMSIVQKYPDLTGQQKKDAVINVMTKLVNETTLVDPEYKTSAIFFIQVTLPPTIDLIKSSYKRNVDLKKVKNGDQAQAQMNCAQCNIL